MEVLQEVAGDGGPSEEPVFVFGSNLAGRHGRGAAYFAATYRGAVRGVGEGLTGNAYALPTKDERLGPRSLPEVAAAVQRFLEVALSNPTRSFLVTRVGCGLAGFSDEAIAPMFTDAPENVDLPVRWRQIIHGSGVPHVIVAHPTGFDDQSVVSRTLDHILSRFPDSVLITGQWRGAGDLGAAYAMRTWPQRDVPFLAYPVDSLAYGPAAPMVRYQEMARVATHLVAFRSPSSSDVGALVTLASGERLISRVIAV